MLSIEYYLKSLTEFQSFNSPACGMVSQEIIVTPVSELHEGIKYKAGVKKKEKENDKKISRICQLVL